MKQPTELEVISLVHVTSFQVSGQVLPLTKYHWPYLLFYLFIDFRLFVFDGLVNYLPYLLSQVSWRVGSQFSSKHFEAS